MILSNSLLLLFLRVSAVLILKVFSARDDFGTAGLPFFSLYLCKSVLLSAFISGKVLLFGCGFVALCLSADQR